MCIIIQMKSLSVSLSFSPTCSHLARSQSVSLSLSFSLCFVSKHSKHYKITEIAFWRVADCFKHANTRTNCRDMMRKNNVSSFDESGVMKLSKPLTDKHYCEHVDTYSNVFQRYCTMNFGVENMCFSIGCKRFGSKKLKMIEFIVDPMKWYRFDCNLIESQIRMKLNEKVKLLWKRLRIYHGVNGGGICWTTTTLHGTIIHIDRLQPKIFNNNKWHKTNGTTKEEEKKKTRHTLTRSFSVLLSSSIECRHIDCWLAQEYH